MAPKEPASRDEMFPLIYGELRKLARRYLGSERGEQTIRPTALVHEAWRHLQSDGKLQWRGGTHGLALGAQAMRRLLIDHGRHQKREKRRGGVGQLSFDELMNARETAGVPIEDLVTLEAAMTRLEQIDPRAGQVVALRFFSGMTSPEVAEYLHVSVRAVEADWSHALAWLKRELLPNSR